MFLFHSIHFDKNNLYKISFIFSRYKKKKFRLRDWSAYDRYFGIYTKRVQCAQNNCRIFLFLLFFFLFCMFIRNTRRAICWSSMKNKGRYERYSCIHFAPITSTALEIIAFLTPRAPCIRSVRRLGTFASDNIAVLVAASCNETATYSDGGRCLTG